MMLRHYPRQNFLLAMLSIVVLSIAPAFAQPQSWAQAGMLTCNLNPTIGFVIFGHQIDGMQISAGLGARPGL
jgi:hypothetical protein